MLTIDYLMLLLVVMLWVELAISYVGLSHKELVSSFSSSLARQCRRRRQEVSPTALKMTREKKDRNYNTFVSVKSNFEAQTILEHDDNCSLKDYMQLPVDQYVCIKMPLNAELKRLNSNLFNLTVPPVTFFNLQVSPTVQCVVSQTKDAVVIESDNVHLSGSPYVESLNGCFKIRIQTIFNWIDRADYKAILSRSSIDVSVDPPAPFKFFGKRVLESTGNLAMSIALRQIENAFVTNLGDDFSRWAVNADYRKIRAGGTCEVGSGVREVSGESVQKGIDISNPVDTRLQRGADQRNERIEDNELAGKGDDVGEALDGSTPEQLAPQIAVKNLLLKEGASNSSDVVDSAEARGSKAPIVITTEPRFELKSEVPGVNIVKKVSFPEQPEPEPALEEDSSKPIALRDIPLRSGSGPQSLDELEKKRRKESTRAFNTEVETPNPGISIPFKTMLIDDTPASLLDDVCLIPGEPIVRVEEAPDNARRIFTGIDIFADIEDVWAVLTDYDNLGNVIPSLVKNEVLERRADGGARLEQVGGAKILPGLTFTAKTVLDVCVYKEDSPIPEEMTADHLPGAPGSSAGDREVREYDRTLPLRRGVFPRPYAITQLKHRDITMQNVEGMGDFDHYQGIWRLQRLPNCAPDGGDAARLTYAVELRPKGFLPVSLIEGRIAGDLKNNLDAIRKYVEVNMNSRSRRVSQETGRGLETTDSFAETFISTSSSLNKSPIKSNTSTLSSLYSDTSILSLSGEKSFENVSDLELVLAVIKLARIHNIALGKEGSEANYSDNNTTTAKIDNDSNHNDNVRTDCQGDSTIDDLFVGDNISPKKWSYRRLLITGSGYVRDDVVALIKKNKQLVARVTRLREQLQGVEEILESIRRVLPSRGPAEYTLGTDLSSVRLANIEEILNKYFRSSEAVENGDFVGVADPEQAVEYAQIGQGSGDTISDKEWSFRRLLITGSGYVKSYGRDYTRENNVLEAKCAGFEAKLATRAVLLSQIRDLSGPLPLPD